MKTAYQPLTNIHCRYCQYGPSGQSPSACWQEFSDTHVRPTCFRMDASRTIQDEHWLARLAIILGIVLLGLILFALFQ